MSEQETLLVSGASGHLGTLVLQSLLKTKDLKIIATTRDPSKLKDFADRGVEVRKADFSDASSLDGAFKGATRLLLISTDAVGARTAQHTNAINAAKKAGVKHIIYTSVPNPDRSLALVAKEHTETEVALEASGLTYTILRNNLYTDYLEPSYQQALKSGLLFGARKGSPVAYVTRHDCAEAAAKALSSSDSFNAIYDVAGPESVSLDDLAAIFSRASGKTIKAVDVPYADFLGGLIGSGLDKNLAEVLATFEKAIAQGTLVSTGKATTSVQQFFNR